MKAVGIKMLKNRLSEYVRAAAAGETVLVLDREQVVAELGPPSPFRKPTVTEEWKAEAIRKGYLTPALEPRPGPPLNVPKAKLAALLRELDRDREDR